MLRIISLLFILAAAAALGYDLYRSTETSQFTSTALGKLWFDLHSPSLNLSQAIIERYIWPKLWDPLILTLLQWPAWIVFIGFAIFFLLLSRMFGGLRRKR